MRENIRQGNWEFFDSPQAFEPAEDRQLNEVYMIGSRLLRAYGALESDHVIRSGTQAGLPVYLGENLPSLTLEPRAPRIVGAIAPHLIRMGATSMRLEFTDEVYRQIRPGDDLEHRSPRLRFDFAQEAGVGGPMWSSAWIEAPGIVDPGRRWSSGRLGDHVESAVEGADPDASLKQYECRQLGLVLGELLIRYS